MSSRASPRDWCATGLGLLRNEGMNSLTVERLCGAMGKTKGSFYHHFADLDAYLAAVLAQWADELTEGPIRAAAEEADPRRRGARLNAAVSELDHRLDVAVRAWARWDPRARKAMARVDERRIEYLAELHRVRGARSPRDLAELEYASFVGAQQLGLLDSPARAGRLSRLGCSTARSRRWGIGRGAR